MEDLLKDYNADISDEDFKVKYAGVFNTKNRVKIEKEEMLKIWHAFLGEMDEFLLAHKNLTQSDIERIGIDKFILTMGFYKPEDVSRWKLNKVRIGSCGHCKNQFIPMMFQHNYGLCDNCRPKFSSIGIREFVKKQMSTERYANSTQDLWMDFFIMFYSDDLFRGLFLKGTDFSSALEKEFSDLPEFMTRGDAHHSHELVEVENGIYEIQKASTQAATQSFPKKRKKHTKNKEK